jgi:hypothetical protein
MGWREQSRKRRDMKLFLTLFKTALPTASEERARAAAELWMETSHDVEPEEWILAIVKRGWPLTEAYMRRFRLAASDFVLEQIAFQRLGQRYGMRDFSKAFPPYQMVEEWEASGSQPEDFVTEVLGFEPEVAQLGGGIHPKEPPPPVADATGGEDNPFLALQSRRLLEGGRTKGQGVRAAVGDMSSERRKPTKQFMDAWLAAFGTDMAGYGVGIDAWFPLRDDMSAAEFIKRFVPKTSRR